MNQGEKLTEATMRALQGKLNEGWTADGRDCWDVYEKELNALVKNAPDTFKPYGEYNFIYTPKNVYVALRPETLTDENDGKPEMDFVIFATADDMISDYDSNIGIDWQDISDPEKYWEYVAKYANKVADKFKTSTKKENKSIKTEAKTANDSEDYFTFVLGYDLLQDKFAKENLECDTAYEKASKIAEDFMNSEEYKDKSKSGYDALVDYLQNNKLTENKKIVEDEKVESKSIKIEAEEDEDSDMDDDEITFINKMLAKEQSELEDFLGYELTPEEFDDKQQLRLEIADIYEQMPEEELELFED